MIVKDERVARDIAEARAQKQRAAELAGSAKVSLDDLFAKIQEGDAKELPIVIKADVQGSAEALAAAVEKMPAGAVKLKVMHSGVGGITEPMCYWRLHPRPLSSVQGSPVSLRPGAGRACHCGMVRC